MATAEPWKRRRATLRSQLVSLSVDSATFSLQAQPQRGRRGTGGKTRFEHRQSRLLAASTAAEGRPEQGERPDLHAVWEEREGSLRAGLQCSENGTWVLKGPKRRASRTCPVLSGNIWRYLLKRVKGGSKDSGAEKGGEKVLTLLRCSSSDASEHPSASLSACSAQGYKSEFARHVS